MVLTKAAKIWRCILSHLILMQEPELLTLSHIALMGKIRTTGLLPLVMLPYIIKEKGVVLALSALIRSRFLVQMQETQTTT